MVYFKTEKTPHGKYTITKYSDNGANLGMRYFYPEKDLFTFLIPGK
jgi:hypothetical protein